MDNQKEVDTGVTSSMVGAAIGSVVTGLGLTSAIIGKFPIIKPAILGAISNNFKNKAIGSTVTNVLGTITSTITGTPAILPIAGGLLAVGAGALIGNSIAKSKLNHQSLKLDEKSKVM